MNGLILHCGASQVERSQLDSVATPQATETWFPIPHHSLLGQVENKLRNAGLKIVNEAHALTHDGNRYFGLLQVNDEQRRDFALVLGIRNSHDQRFPAGLVVGASIFCCDNLSFSGEIRIDRKHTRFINRDLPQLVEVAIGRLADQRHKQEVRFLTYQRTELTDGEAHDLVIQALDAQVLPVTKIPDVLNEWREPRHQEFREGGKTAWRLFNSFTEIGKGALERLPRRTQALHGILDTHVGLLTVDAQTGHAVPADIEIATPQAI